MTFWKKKLEKKIQKNGVKKIFFSGQKKFFLWVMAHWNYGQMTMKTWVELCLDFEHFVIFFCKKMHIYILKIFWINCTCLLNYKKFFWKNKKKNPPPRLEPTPTQKSSQLNSLHHWPLPLNHHRHAAFLEIVSKKYL